jgi:cytochrome c5
MKGKMFKQILLLISASLLLISCGKKEESIKSQDTSKNQQQTQQLTDQKNQQQTQTTQTKDDGSTKTTEKKEETKSTEKKEEPKQTKKEEPKKEETKKVETPVTKETVDFSKVWPKKCNKCHGPDGKGKVEGVPDITKSKTKSKSDTELHKIISDGVKGKTDDDEDMPAWKGKLTDEEINAAIKYVRSF